jgi:hypothetical protein
MKDRPWIGILAGAVGGAVAIAAMEFLSARSALPLAFIPFATSIVLVMDPHSHAHSLRATCCRPLSAS